MTLKAEIERFAVRGNYRECAHADESFARARRPRAHRPPAIQFLHPIKVRSDYHDRLSVRRAGDNIRERNRNAREPPRAVSICWRASAGREVPSLPTTTMFAP